MLTTYQKKDKIVLSINSLQGAGAERFVLTIGAAFYELGFDVHILRFDPKVEFTLDPNLNYHLIEYKSYRWLPRGKDYKLRNFLFAKVVDSYILKNIGEPTLLLSNLERSYNIFCYSRLPNIVYVIHNTLSLLYKFNRIENGEQTKVNFVNIYSKHPCACVSKGVEKDFIENFGNITSTRTIHNPIDRDNIKKLANAFVPKYQNYIIHVGSFKEAKRHDILLKAYAQTNQSQPLLLLGQGKLKGEIEQLVVALNLEDKVIFLGFNENPYPYIKHAQFMVLTSDWEGFALVIAESLALGTPVISTDCPSGPSELLPSNNLMPMSDIDAIATKMSKSMENPKQFQAPFDEALIPIKIAKKYIDFIDSLN